MVKAGEEEKQHAIDCNDYFEGIPAVSVICDVKGATNTLTMPWLVLVLYLVPTLRNFYILALEINCAIFVVSHKPSMVTGGGCSSMNELLGTLSIPDLDERKYTELETIIGVLWQRELMQEMVKAGEEEKQYAIDCNDYFEGCNM